MSTPGEWKTEPLGRIARISMGQSPDSKYYSQEDSGWPFLQGCAEFQSRFPASTLFCNQKCKLGKRGSILLSVRAPVGRINIADRDYIIGRGLAAIEGLGVDQDYLEQYLTYVGPSLRNASQGSAFEAINSTELNAWPITYPPDRPEQTKIAEILSTVDQAIEQTETLIAKQQRVKTGLMQDLLTRGIDEHGNLRSEQTHAFKDSPLGRIPVEWEVESLQRACDRVSVGIATSTTRHFRSEGIPLMRNQNVLDGQFDLTDLLYISTQFDEINKSKRLRAGDLVTMRTGYPGRTAVVTESMRGWQTFTTLISSPKKSKYVSQFLSLQMNSFVGRKQITTLQGGGAQQNLNVGWICNMQVLRPTLDEQERMVARLDSVDCQIANSAVQLKKLHLLKTALMQDLLTGRKRVTPLLESEPKREKTYARQ